MSDLRGFLLELCFRSFPLNFRFFFFERWQGKLCVELARLIILFGVVPACAPFCLAFISVCLGVEGTTFCRARAVSFLFRFGLTQLFLGGGCLGFPVGLSQSFVCAVAAGKMFWWSCAADYVCFASGSWSFLLEFGFRGFLLGFGMLFFCLSGGDRKNVL